MIQSKLGVAGAVPALTLPMTYPVLFSCDLIISECIYKVMVAPPVTDLLHRVIEIAGAVTGLTLSIVSPMLRSCGLIISECTFKVLITIKVAYPIAIAGTVSALT